MEIKKTTRGNNTPSGFCNFIMASESVLTQIRIF